MKTLWKTLAVIYTMFWVFLMPKDQRWKDML
jgi:hypothetical protein